jgi:hypothetical protein
VFDELWNSERMSVLGFVERYRQPKHSRPRPGPAGQLFNPSVRSIAWFPQSSIFAPVIDFNLTGIN